MLWIDKRAAQYAWTAALVLLLLYLTYLMRTTLFVFIVALLFAYLLAPLVDVIDRLLPGRRTRMMAMVISYMIFIAILFVGATQIGSRIVEQANSLAKSLPALLAKWQQPTPSAPSGVNSLKQEVLRKVQDQLSKSSGDIIASLPRAGAKILAVVSNLVYVVIVPILGFFFLKDGKTMRRDLLEMIEDGGRRNLVDDLLADVDLLLAHYMRAVLMLSVATFTSYSIFFTILGVPYSFLLAALAGTLEFIPMIGPLSANIVILIVTAASGGPVLGALVFLLGYRVFQDYILSPHLMHAGVQLHPLLALFGVFAGAEIAGVAGAFLSVPLLALIRIFYYRLRKARTVVKLSASEPVKLA